MNALELVKELEAQRAENQSLRNELAQALESLEQANARIKQLEGQAAENRTLHDKLARALEQLEQTNARIKQLEGQAAKDSHNSSKPPSSNGFKEPVRKTQSLREKSGKKSGGEVGHVGNTLRMVEHPDHIMRLTPGQCQQCQQDLSQASLCRTERVQMFDVPSLGLQVTEYQVARQGVSVLSNRDASRCARWTDSGLGPIWPQRQNAGGVSGMSASAPVGSRLPDLG